MIDGSTQTAYDLVPYPSLSYAQSHPDRMATLATLLGMKPTPITHCRVLELGCASGGNVIPMAYELPESEFVGIDSSAHQIAEGQETLAALGFENITLKHTDILDVTAELGQFDYIIAHGVFSWVPRNVQEKLLEICRENLAPEGVAYVSYNSYPGWHLMGIIRDMMLYHTRELTDPAMRVGQARALLDFLAESIPANNDAYGSFLNAYAQFLRGELKGASERGNAFLLHDELEEVNEPFYFYQFAERAQSHDLQYLGEAEFHAMVDTNFTPQISEKLREMSGTGIELEQYMDFLRNRMFRQTLLCHEGVKLSRSLRPDQMTSYFVASCAQPEAPEPDIHSVSVVPFRASDGATLSTDHPVSKAAMTCLNELWPRAIPFDALLPMARARLGLEPSDGGDDASLAQDKLVLAANMLKAFSYSGNLVELHTHAPNIASEISERPIASPVARFQVRNSNRVTNLRHERVRLDDVSCYLLPYVDGSHDQAALVRLLETGPVAEGALSIQKDGKPTDPADLRRILTEGVEERIRWLARAALLIG